MLNTNIFHETVVRWCDGLRKLKRPDTGIGVCYKTLRDWARTGLIIRGPGSKHGTERTTLEYMYIGPNPVTSVEAFERFHLRCSGINVQSPVSRKKPKGTRT